MRTSPFPATGKVAAPPPWYYGINWDSPLSTSLALCADPVSGVELVTGTHGFGVNLGSGAFIKSTTYDPKVGVALRSSPSIQGGAAVLRWAVPTMAAFPITTAFWIRWQLGQGDFVFALMDTGLATTSWAVQGVFSPSLGLIVSSTNVGTAINGIAGEPTLFIYESSVSGQTFAEARTDSGALLTSSSTNGFNGQPIGFLDIGARFNGVAGSAVLNANIGPIMVWDRALNITERRALFDPITRWSMFAQPMTRVFYDLGARPPLPYAPILLSSHGVVQRVPGTMRPSGFTPF